MAPPRGGSVEFHLDISGLALTAAGRGETRPSMTPARGGSVEFQLDISGLARPPLAEVELGLRWHLRGGGGASSISTSASLPGRPPPEGDAGTPRERRGWECRVPSRHQRACPDRRWPRWNSALHGTSEGVGSVEFHLDVSELARPPLAEVELGPPWHLRGWECRVPSRHQRACPTAAGRGGTRPSMAPARGGSVDQRALKLSSSPSTFA